MAMKFLTKWVVEPIDSLTYAFRQVLAKMGLMQSFDDFVYNRIEDPLFYNLFKKMFKYQSYNDEVIPKEGAAIIASNHQSLLDPIITGLAVVHNSKRSPYQLAKAELGVDPFLNNFTRMNKAIFIRRGDTDTDALERCKTVLMEGNLLVTFPEGTINEGNGKMLPFHTGVARMAFEAKAPVIPVATYGVDQIYGKGAKMPKTKGILRVKFGDLIPLDKLFKITPDAEPTHDDYDKATKRIQREVGKLWTDLWMEATNEAKDSKDNNKAKDKTPAVTNKKPN